MFDETGTWPSWVKKVVAAVAVVAVVANRQYNGQHIIFCISKGNYRTSRESGTFVWIYRWRRTVVASCVRIGGEGNDKKRLVCLFIG